MLELLVSLVPLVSFSKIIKNNKKERLSKILDRRSFYLVILIKTTKQVLFAFYEKQYLATLQVPKLVQF